MNKNKNNKKKRKIFLKPIEIDAHFKYRCPKCACDHWISLNEAKTKNFKIVCYCSVIIKPKRISSIKIRYCEDLPLMIPVKESVAESQVVINNSDTAEVSESLKIDTEILDKCTRTLVGYGFTKEEAEDLITNIYQKNPSNDCGQLIKQALKSFGGNNE